MNYLDALAAFEGTPYDHDEEVIPKPVEPHLILTVRYHYMI